MKHGNRPLVRREPTSPRSSFPAVRRRSATGLRRLPPVASRAASRRILLVVIGCAAIALVGLAAAVSQKSTAPRPCDGNKIIQQADQLVFEGRRHAENRRWKQAISTTDQAFRLAQDHRGRSHACSVAAARFDRVASEANYIRQRRDDYVAQRLDDARTSLGVAHRTAEEGKLELAEEAVKQAEASAQIVIDATDPTDESFSKARRIAQSASSQDALVQELSRIEKQKRDLADLKNPERIKRELGCDGVVRIEADVPGGDAHIGSGFLIDAEGTIVTNRHVIEGATCVSAKIIGTHRLLARVLYVSDRLDFAILQVDARRLPAGATPLHLAAASAARLSTDAAALGFLGGVENLRVEVGRIGPPETYDGVEYLPFAADVGHGYSGGPLVDLRSGQVIGMTTFKVSNDSQGHCR